MKKIAYRYNGLTRPDLGLVNGELYIADEVKEAGWFQSKSIRIGNRWFIWAGFTEVIIEDPDIKAIKRNNVIDSIFS